MSGLLGGSVWLAYGLWSVVTVSFNAHFTSSPRDPCGSGAASCARAIPPFQNKASLPEYLLLSCLIKLMYGPSVSPGYKLSEALG